MTNLVSMMIALVSASPMQGKPAAPAQGAPKPDAPKAESKGSEAGHGDWIADFDEAVKVAKAEGKDLLVDFTGSDWCGWCIKLHDEVFSHAEFLDGTQDDFVRVALDFPRTEPVIAKVPNMKRNKELAAKYHIQGYPTVLLMTPEGDVYGKSGYMQGGPDPYVKNLAELRDGGKKSLEELQAFAKSVDAAKGPEQEKLLGESLEKLAAETAKEDSAFRFYVADIARKGYKADPKNEKGLKLKTFEAIIEAGAGDESDFAIGRELDPKNEKGILEKAVEGQLGTLNDASQIPGAIKWIEDLDAVGPIKDKDRATRFYVTAARWSMMVAGDKAKPEAEQTKAKETAKKFAQKAKDLGVSDNPQLAAMLEQILKA